MRIYDMRKESIFNRGAQWEERKKMAKLKKKIKDQRNNTTQMQFGKTSVLGSLTSAKMTSSLHEELHCQESHSNMHDTQQI